MSAAQETSHEARHRQIDHDHRLAAARSARHSEKRANEQQPGSYKDKETAEKLVTIPPTGPDKKPIRGLDSK